MTRVLVVEDNSLNMELLLEILHAKGFSVDKAEDGKEAVEKAKKIAHDLILMDIELPAMDGIEATRLIKEMHPYVPVIAITSYAMKGDRERFLAAGFDDYVSKPIDVNEFVGKLKKYRSEGE